VDRRPDGRILQRVPRAGPATLLREATRTAAGAPRAPARSTLAERLAWLAPLTVIFVAARLALVFALGDVFFHGEELAKAAAGKAMLDGLGVEHHRLAYHYYEGGGFVVSHLDALTFQLLGENLLALKLVALALAVLTLWAGCILCERAFGRASAIAFGALFTFAPASFQKLSLLALGIHFESLLFVILVLHFTWRILFDGDRRARTFLFLGLAGGFGTYFSYPCALVFAYSGLALCALRPRALATRASLAGWAGLALGLAPLGLMWVLVGERVLDIHGQDLLAAGARPKAELLRDFLASLFAGRGAFDAVALALVPCAALVGLAALLLEEDERRARSRGLFLLGYGAVFAAAYLAGGFTVGAVYHHFLFERLSQAWLVVLLLAAAGLPRLIVNGGGSVPSRAAGWLLLLGLLSAGIADTFALVSAGAGRSLAGSWRLLRSTKGYDYPDYVGKVEGHLAGQPRTRLAVLSRFDEPDPPLLRAALGRELLSRIDSAPSRPFELAQEAGGPLGAADYVRGFGPLWRRLYGDDLPETLRSALAVAPSGLGRAVEESVGRYGLGHLASLERLQREVQIGLEVPLPAGYFRGLGYRLYSVLGSQSPAPYWQRRELPFAIDRDAAARFILRQDPSIQPQLLEGWRLAVSEHELPAR
jgi:hypothetical protein